MTPSRPDPIALLTGRLSDSPRPESITDPNGGGKFAPDGTVLPFPGNTIICHIDRESRAWRALVAMQTALRAGPLAHNFTFLPPESFHMTVFAGVSGPAGAGGRWPEDIPETASLKDVTADLLDRVRGLDFPPRRRIRPMGLFGGYSVTVQGANAAEEHALRESRERLRDTTKLRPPDFESYVFHITLGYQLRWLSEPDAREIVAFSDRLFADFVTEVPEIELGALEFCSFESMHRFDTMARLGRSEAQTNA